MLHEMERCRELDLDEDTQFSDNNTGGGRKKGIASLDLFCGFCRGDGEEIFKMMIFQNIVRDLAVKVLVEMFTNLYNIKINLIK